jgi:hypothetical protein
MITDLVTSGVPWMRYEAERDDESGTVIWVDHADHGGATATGVIILPPGPYS